MTTPTDRARRQAGLTLIEMVIASAILLVVATAAMAVLVAGQRVTGFTDRRGQTQDDVRLAVDRLTKDLRQTTQFTTTFPAATGWSGHDLQFRTYTAANPDTPVPVRWWVAGTTLYREEFDAAGTSVAKVAMLQGIVPPAAGQPDLFTCDVLQGSDATTGTPVPWQITVTLTVQVSDPGRTIATQTQVQLRNLQIPQPA